MNISRLDHPLVTGLKALTTPSYIRGSIAQTSKVIAGMMKPPKDSRDHGNNAPTVLLTHGFSTNPKVMETLGNVLAEKANIAYAPDFPALCTKDILQSAALLRAKIDQVLQEEKNDDLIMLGHSAGGLIILETMRKSRYSFRKLIACATPFQGTPQARLAPFLPICRQISPGSDYLQSLREIDLTTIPIDAHVSEYDNVVPLECQVPAMDQPSQIKLTPHPFQHFDFIVGRKAKGFGEEIAKEI